MRNTAQLVLLPSFLQQKMLSWTFSNFLHVKGDHCDYQGAGQTPAEGCGPQFLLMTSNWGQTQIRDAKDGLCMLLCGAFGHKVGPSRCLKKKKIKWSFQNVEPLKPKHHTRISLVWDLQRVGGLL